MNSTATPSLQKPLYLTQEEALTLMEMCLFSSAEDSPINGRVLLHVSDLCRQFLRTEAAEPEQINADPLWSCLQNHTLQSSKAALSAAIGSPFGTNSWLT